MVLLNAHAAAAAVALLPAPHLPADERRVDLDPRRNSTHHGHQRFAVALSRCRKTKHELLIIGRRESNFPAETRLPLRETRTLVPVAAAICSPLAKC